MSDNKKLTETEKRLLKAMFRDENVDEEELFDGDYYCILMEPHSKDDYITWFGMWIKYRDDLPDDTKEWLDQAGVKPGESVPLFTPAGKDRPSPMAFKYKGMAKYTKEKIEGMYPELKGKMHIMVYEEAPVEVEPDKE